MKRLLFGTSNQAKLGRIRAVASDLPLEIISIKDLQINITIEEDGNNIHENALKKARAYYNESGFPTLSIDSGLYIDGFHKDKQPGVLVRRINGKRATDEEMLNYYSSELIKIGGESNGRWLSSITFIITDDIIKQYEIVEERLFTARQSATLVKDLPLSSLAIDPTFNKYVSEISKGEREQLQEKTDRELYNILAEVIEEL